jgi:hypothetical protein
VLDIDGATISVRHQRATWDREPLLARCAELAPDVSVLRELLTR